MNGNGDPFMWEIVPESTSAILDRFVEVDSLEEWDEADWETVWFSLSGETRKACIQKF